jgi:hypothetical protein
MAESEEMETTMEVENKLNEKKFRRLDSFSLEAGRVFRTHHPSHSPNVSQRQPLYNTINYIVFF